MAKNQTPPPSQAADLDPRQQIIDAYKKLVAAGTDEVTTYAVAQAVGLTEAELHQHFPSADAIGRAAWQQLAERVLAKLQASEAFRNYGARERILAYSFTFFADAPADRSFIRNTWDEPALITDYRSAFKRFAHDTLQEGIALDEVQPRFGMDNLYPDWLYGVHCNLIDFWLRDESTDFAETERAIEMQHKLPLEFMGRNLLDTVGETVIYQFQQLKLDRAFADIQDELRKAASWFTSK